MATGKKSFVLYCDITEILEDLSVLERGELFTIIVDYVNDKNPVIDDKLMKIAFKPIKQQLKRDLVKWGEKKKQWSDAGKASAEKRRLAKMDEIQRSSTDVESRSTDSTVNDTANVTVNVNEITINKQFEFFWTQYHSITKIPKTDKVPAFSYFKKLTLDERRKAYTMIQGYSDSNKDKQYIKKARTYLSDKCFNDEFKALENSKIYRKNEQ